MRRREEAEIRKAELRILAAKNGASQVLKTIASWSENEMSTGRNWKLKTLEKVLKDIRDPKDGVSTRALSYVFTSENYCPLPMKALRSGDGNMYDRRDDLDSMYHWSIKSMTTATNLVSRLKKRDARIYANTNNSDKIEGLNIITVRCKDKTFGVVEDRHSNAFWNDVLQEKNFELKLKHAESYLTVDRFSILVLSLINHGVSLTEFDPMTIMFFIILKDLLYNNLIGLYYKVFKISSKGTVVAHIHPMIKNVKRFHKFNVYHCSPIEEGHN